MRRILIIGAAVMLILAATGFALFRAPAPPALPIGMSLPPSIESGYHAVTKTERTFDLEINQFRRWMDQGQMVKALRSSDAIAKPAEITYLSGKWPGVGAVRRVQLEDGHYVLERVLANEFPGLFRYQVWGFTNSAGNLVKYAVGEFRFNARDDGKTQFIWTYQMRPKSVFLRPVLNNFVKTRFAPFMKGGMDGLAPPAQPAPRS
jgi:hypothetical protein